MLSIQHPMLKGKRIGKAQPQSLNCILESPACNSQKELQNNHQDRSPECT